MNPAYEKLLASYEQISDYIPFKPKVALVLGSGLGDYIESGNFKKECSIGYAEIEGFPVSTAPGHRGRFVFGYVGDVPTVCMQGRLHAYEGYEMNDVVMPIRMMKLMGAEILILTNAAGGIKRGMKPGSLMLITDHISSFVESPLVGENIMQLGNRFPDMSEIYKKDLRTLVKRVAINNGIDLEEGVYIQFRGPNYETPAEIHMASVLGADAVGMSTAVEALAANHMGMRVVGISCISNLAAGISPTPLTEEEVLETGRMVEATFTKLVTESIKEMGKL